MVASRVLLILVVLTAATSPTTAVSSITPLCSPAEEAAGQRTSTEPNKCVIQRMYFDVCDDDCLAHYQRVATTASNCSTSGGSTVTSNGSYRVEDCQRSRGVVAAKYVPKESTGLRNCTIDDREVWDKTTDVRTPYNDCAMATLADPPSCSDTCLKLIETTIAEAPQCARDGAFSMGEIAKPALVSCLRVINGDFTSNNALQTVVAAGDGSGNKASGSEKKSTGAATNAPATSAATTQRVAAAAWVSVLFVTVAGVGAGQFA